MGGGRGRRKVHIVGAGVLQQYRTVRHWHRSNTTIANLNKLDDRMLADIGMVRSDIRNLARRLG